ncbi:MAG: Radical protein [Euryarchaeota archaeon]|nr:Radical protein [Euryarchaeota archaeon]
MNEYLSIEKSTRTPRLPFEGGLDLTYRCNNNCRHCWLRIAPGAPEQQKELSTEEIKSIVDQARRMGCKSWHISGGEPMLRNDFAEIFDYITSRSISYSLNTNGTLITPEIAQLLKRKGSKMVALYGATAVVHDHVTRNPGSFQAAMRGFELLKEAGAGFTVQLIPMKDNYHQFPQMVELAKSLSTHWRVGAAWLYLSACGSEQKNAEIASQRLPPCEVIDLDKPDVSFEEQHTDDHCRAAGADDRLFARCIESRRSFHVDPNGQMTFCGFIKDPTLRYDLRKGSFQEAWDQFIPSLSDRVLGGKEYRENCGSCLSRSDCRWCPVYAYLEHGRYGAKIDYLCQVADEGRAFKDNWLHNHRRYYKIAGITIQVESDLPITEDTFDPKFRQFQADGPGPKGDTIFIHHHFSLPDLEGKDLGREVYRKAPWAVCRKGHSWVYLGISPNASDPKLHRVATFSDDHSHARIYNDREDVFLKGGLHSLTLFPTDQILLSRVLAEREACFLHSAGMILEGKGLLFVGHSEAGKSTTVKMMMDRAEILCDDRNIVRKWPEGFRVHGSWSHGEVPLVSAAGAPLNAILFLKKSDQNRIIPITKRMEIIQRLMACIIKPFVTADWWQKMITLLEKIAKEVPCYEMEFDKSGGIVPEIEGLLQSRPDCNVVAQ